MSSMTTDKPPTGTDDDSSGSYWRSRGTIAAAVVLASVAAAAAWAVATGGKSDHSPATAAYGSACGLTGGSTTTPTEAPEVQWQNIGGSWLPVSTTQGPGARPAAGPWSCYAHTPTGAVLAAWTIPGRMAPGSIALIVKQQTLPGPGQAALLALGPTLGPVEDLPTGFEINAYDGTTATVTLYAQKAGVVARCATTLQWVGGDKGDWALRLASDGGSRVGCEQVLTNQRPRNFVAWGPHS